MFFIALCPCLPRYKMDALGNDFMLPEYQEKRREAAEYIRKDAETTPEPKTSEEDDSKYEEDVGSSSTVPAVEVDLSEAVEQSSPGNPPTGEGGGGGSSSRNSSVDSNSSRGHSSIYNPSFISDGVNYERDNSNQKLVAVFGREFDMPNKVAVSLQKLVGTGLPALTSSSPIKFVPFTLKRKTLLKGTFDSTELERHDLICMCYNASEARIMLTGTDGFYSSLLRCTESILGPNKVAFLITNYRYPEAIREAPILVCQSLKTRLSRQEPLQVYLENDQVLSWMDSPDTVHLDQLKRLTELERNPRNFLSNVSCVCL